MQIAYLGAGTWGFCLANLLAKKGHSVLMWTIDPEMTRRLNAGEEHPKLPGYPKHSNLRLTTNLAEALRGAELLAEAVTSAGIRPVFESVKAAGPPDCPVVMTSKGIEQNTGLLLTEVVVDVLGEKSRAQVGCLSGPSLAEEVIKGLPTSVVCSAYEPAVMKLIQEVFSTPEFRVYPNSDLRGVGFGGAMKNPIAIACGISDGLGFGDNTKAAIMTRGLHEMCRLAVRLDCRAETLNGLAGMGDLCVTCLSVHSRNYRFGRRLADGLTADEAKARIGMVVEGAYSVISVMQLAERVGIEMPITAAVRQIIYEGLPVRQAVDQLLQRPVKEEHL
jgi:glycerol-3-phosphate dehydrogenase (NAD(P)+)